MCLTLSIPRFLLFCFRVSGSIFLCPPPRLHHMTTFFSILEILYPIFFFISHPIFLFGYVYLGHTNRYNAQELVSTSGMSASQPKEFTEYVSRSFISLMPFLSLIDCSYLVLPLSLMENSLNLPDHRQRKSMVLVPDEMVPAGLLCFIYII